MGISHHSRRKANPATKPGSTVRLSIRATPAFGPRSPPTRKPGLPICRLSHRLPTSTAVIAPAMGLYGNSLVAVDLKTGKMKWYFQTHSSRDLGLRSLLRAAADGYHGRRQADQGRGADPPSRAISYVFDRITGKPVWPIVERPVPKGDVPGEWYAPTQPFPTKPAAYARTGVTPDVLIDFTPAMHQQALELVKNYKIGPDLHAAGRQPAAGTAGNADAGPGQWRHQLAGRILQSGKSHRLCLCLQFVPRVARPGTAAAGACPTCAMWSATRDRSPP